MDLIIGVLVFMLAIGVVYSLLTGQQQEDVAPLRIESEVVATKLTSDQSLKVADSNKLDMSKLSSLATLAEQNYTELKKELGIEHEFCIYVQDEEGNLIYIDAGSGERFTGVGSGTSDVNLSNVPCGRRCTLAPDGTCA